MKGKIIAVLLLFLLFASLSWAAYPDFTINSPKITDKYVDYDIQQVYSGEEKGNVTITMVVWGMINVVPERGYLKEYDVNITSNGYYVHCFLATENGSKAMAYIMVDKKPHLVNYTINTSTLTWFVPSQYFDNITGNFTVNAYAGIADLSKEKFVFLDHAKYPAPKVKEESIPIELYLLTGATIFAVIVALALTIKRLKK
jgi:hypothetical protein